MYELGSSHPPFAASKPPCIGVLGGMGPLASAAFVSTLYKLNRGRCEQDAPAVLLYSNPMMGDRSTVLLQGSEADRRALLHDLAAGIQVLSTHGCFVTIVCCITIHHLFPALAPEQRGRVLSLIDVALTELMATHDRALLVCTTGTRHLRIFERHPLWPLVANRVSLPTEREQHRLHEAIYHLKTQQESEPLREAVTAVCHAHRAAAAIAGCTELHLLDGSTTGAGPHVIDPLGIVARQLTAASRASRAGVCTAEREGGRHEDGSLLQSVCNREL